MYVPTSSMFYDKQFESHPQTGPSRVRVSNVSSLVGCCQGNAASRKFDSGSRDRPPSDSVPDCTGMAVVKGQSPLVIYEYLKLKTVNLISGHVASLSMPLTKGLSVRQHFSKK